MQRIVLHTTKVCWQWVPRRRAGSCESPTTICAEAVRRYRQLKTNSRTQNRRCCLAAIPEHSWYLATNTDFIQRF